MIDDDVLEEMYLKARKKVRFKKIKSFLTTTTMTVIGVFAGFGYFSYGEGIMDFMDSKSEVTLSTEGNIERIINKVPKVRKLSRAQEYSKSINGMNGMIEYLVYVEKDGFRTSLVDVKSLDIIDDYLSACDTGKPKSKKRDTKTPEGIYTIIENHRFHNGVKLVNAVLELSYPNSHDQFLKREEGSARIGGYCFVDIKNNFNNLKHMTLGYVTLDLGDMDNIYKKLKGKYDRTIVVIESSERQLDLKNYTNEIMSVK